MIKATYELQADDLEKAAHELVYGQSIGNPYIRTPYDKNLNEFIPSYHLNSRYLEVNFPENNFGDPYHINYLMSVLMGGQTDIDNIKACRLVELDIPKNPNIFLGPAYGVEGIRKLINCYDRPLIGGIVKPKIGIEVTQLVDICKKMADGGIDFIKEDEILSFQDWCPFEERTYKVQKALDSYNVLYAPCCTSDDFRFPRNPVRIIHINVWCGLGYLQIMRRHVPYKPALFFQKSGEKVWTTGPYSIDFAVICKLINMIGCDFAHVGMYGGYLNEGEAVIKRRLKALNNTIPSFSCGAKPEHVDMLARKFGKDIMISSGGYINGHSKGITYAVKEFRNASDSVKQV